MNTTAKRSLALLIALILVIFACMGIADSIQRNGGKVDVSLGTIETPLGNVTYKLYVPQTATEENKAPGVLLLHGYQNDRETCAAYAIELARRGAVVLSLDEYGHGASEAGLLNRGYVNHRVKTIFGEDSKEDGTFVSVGGAKRYRLMMNFSNLSFFDERYTVDDAGNTLTDSSCGGVAGYWKLSTLPMVDVSRMGVSGHSMGTWSSWSVAAFFSNSETAPKATVLQCGELFRESAYPSENVHFNNVLLLQAKYDEFSYFRDYRNFVDDELLHSDVRAEFLGVDNADCAWDTTFGSFDDGSARRMELLETNHRLTTHDKNGLAAALTWFDNALDLPNDLDPLDQVAIVYCLDLLSDGSAALYSYIDGEMDHLEEYHGIWYCHVEGQFRYLNLSMERTGGTLAQPDEVPVVIMDTFPILVHLDEMSLVLGKGLYGCELPFATDGEITAVFVASAG